LGLIFLFDHYDKIKERMRVEVIIMKTKFYKLRRNRVISGVLSGLADKFNFDPSIASGPFITTVNDLTTVFVYFTIVSQFISVYLVK